MPKKRNVNYNLGYHAGRTDGWMVADEEDLRRTLKEDMEKHRVKDKWDLIAVWE